MWNGGVKEKRWKRKRERRKETKRRDGRRKGKMVCMVEGMRKEKDKKGIEGS